MDFWSIFKAIFEPTLVAVILFTGVYINRNKSRKRLPRENRVSYILNKYPFIMEVIYLLLTYWIYQISRAISVFLPSAQNGTLVSTATQNAEKLIRLESTLGLFHELDVQHFFIQHPILLGIINRVYSYIHIPGTCIFFVWFYKTQKFDVYSPVRRALCVGYPLSLFVLTSSNMIAFTIFTFWPCAPPRFLTSYGFIDTVHSNGNASIWTTNKFCNQYAAMPSLHMGYSFFVGMNLFWWGGVKSKQPIWIRSIYILLGIFYPMLLLLAIVATGNHFFLDAVCGVFVILLALASNRIILVFWPIQRKLFEKLKILQPTKKSDEVDLPLINSPSEQRKSSLEYLNL